MTRMTRMKRSLLALLLLTLPLATPAAAAEASKSGRATKPKHELGSEFPPEPPDARTLLRALATVEGLEAKFIEDKHLALLRAPLSSKGRLYFTRPGHMARMHRRAPRSIARCRTCTTPASSSATPASR